MEKLKSPDCRVRDKKLNDKLVEGPAHEPAPKIKPQLRLLNMKRQSPKSQFASQLNTWADQLEFDIEMIMRS